MITTLSGPNSYALQTDLQQRIQQFIAEYGDLGLERLDGEDAGYDRMREALQSLPFLASKKLVVLRQPSADKQFTERAEQLLGDLSETTEVILVEPKLDKRLGYTKYLQKHTDYHTFDELDAANLASWLITTAKGQGAQLQPADARHLIDRAGPNQQKLRHELDKLILYSPHITAQTIDAMVEPTPQSTIFELLEAAFDGNTQRAMGLYDEQRRLRVEPQQIIGLLAWQLHVLAVVTAAGSGHDAADIARQAKINPYVVRKTQRLARRLPLAVVTQLLQRALVLDTALKTAPIDPDDAVRHYILQLAAD